MFYVKNEKLKLNRNLKDLGNAWNESLWAGGLFLPGKQHCLCSFFFLSDACSGLMPEGSALTIEYAQCMSVCNFRTLNGVIILWSLLNGERIYEMAESYTKYNFQQARILYSKTLLF